MKRTTENRPAACLVMSPERGMATCHGSSISGSPTDERAGQGRAGQCCVCIVLCCGTYFGFLKAVTGERNW